MNTNLIFDIRKIINLIIRVFIENLEYFINRFYAQFIL